LEKIKNISDNMALLKNLALITACGAKKKKYPTKAYELYLSPRIKAVFNRRDGVDMYILSAKYGLVNALQVIEPYDEVMTQEKARILAPQVAKVLKNYKTAIFYKAGARKEYLECMVNACKIAKVNLVAIGYGFMGDVGKIPYIIELLKKRNLKEVVKEIRENCRNPLIILQE